jgi:hypothetical protein
MPFATIADAVHGAAAMRRFAMLVGGVMRDIAAH